MRAVTRMIGKAMALTGLALVAAGSAAYAQYEAYAELMREDIKTQKVAIMTEAMQLGGEQADVFWPIYREYTSELDKLVDRRIALIKDYAANFTTMTDEKAKEIADASFRLQEDRLKLQKQYYKQVEKELGGVIAARFIQTERIINDMMNLQIAAELPLIQKGDAGM